MGHLPKFVRLQEVSPTFPVKLAGGFVVKFHQFFKLTQNFYLWMHFDHLGIFFFSVLIMDLKHIALFLKKKCYTRHYMFLMLNKL